MTAVGIGKTDKVLKKALRYVSDYWVPMDRDLLDKIREGLRSGFYDDERELLAREMQADLGVFFGCIRELRDILQGTDDRILDTTDLTAVIEDADIKFVRLAIDNLGEYPSVHILSESDQQQVDRLLEGVISTSCAHTLAPGYGEDPGEAASVAALRQLGYSLIAWNYPSVYQEALEALQTSADESLDRLIASRLGFTPLLLAARLAESWGLSKELQEAALIPGAPLFEEAHIISSSHGTIAEICRVSEALARAQFGDRYPQARTEWDIAVHEVERHLGSDGIEKIRSRCADVCRSTLYNSPDIFRPGLLLDEDFFTELSSIDAHKNPYLRLCSIDLQTQLLELYTLLKENAPSERALRFLMRNVIPSTRFSGVCVFTVDSTEYALVPQIEIGSMELRAPRPVSYLDDSGAQDPVPIAFLATDGCAPVVSEHNRAKLGCISSAFGRSQRLGVMYVEIPLEELRKGNDQHLTHFRAVTHALVDCLGL